MVISTTTTTTTTTTSNSVRFPSHVPVFWLGLQCCCWLVGCLTSQQHHQQQRQIPQSCACVLAWPSVLLLVGWLLNVPATCQCISGTNLRRQFLRAATLRWKLSDQTFHLTQSQYTDTGPTSPSADPITPGAWQGSHWSANF